MGVSEKGLCRQLWLFNRKSDNNYGILGVPHFQTNAYQEMVRVRCSILEIQPLCWGPINCRGGAFGAHPVHFFAAPRSCLMAGVSQESSEGQNQWGTTFRETWHNQTRGSTLFSPWPLRKLQQSGRYSPIWESRKHLTESLWAWDPLTGMGWVTLERAPHVMIQWWYLGGLASHGERVQCGVCGAAQRMLWGRPSVASATAGIHSNGQNHEQHSTWAPNFSVSSLWGLVFASSPSIYIIRHLKKRVKRVNARC